MHTLLCGNGIRCYTGSSNVTASYNTISYVGYNLEFTSSGGGTLDGECLSVQGSSNIIFYHNSCEKIRRGVVYYTSSAITGGEVYGNTINDYTYSGITIAGDTSDSWTDLKIYNNVVVSSLSPSSNGIYLASPSTDCLVVNNYIEGGHNNFQITDTGWTLKNNISVNPDGSYHVASSSTFIADYNDYYHDNGTKYWQYNGGSARSVFSDYQTDSSQEANSITSDPLLNSSYHLKKGSPCRDAGSTISGVTTEYYGSAVDIGWKEYDRRGSGDLSLGLGNYRKLKRTQP